MTRPPSPPSLNGKLGTKRVGVVDVGSNTVRLVVYEGPARIPIPIFNEKVQCGLGKDLDETGRLSAESRDRALETMTRFHRLCKAMGVHRLHVVATAAVRDAGNGTKFAKTVRSLLGWKVVVLSDEEEAKLAARGVLCGLPEADGLVGDLGGGSLDLVALNHGSFGEHASLPLGHLRIRRDYENRNNDADTRITKHFSRLDWLEQIQGRTLYAIGGSWRAIARVLIEQTGYPLHVLDNYTISARAATQLLHAISRQTFKSFERIPRLSHKRIETLPTAALVLQHLIAAAKPRKLVFSGYGMREGQYLKNLPAELTQEDPLLGACRVLAEHWGQFGQCGDEMCRWLDALLQEETSREIRLRHAACLLSEIAWNDHPDYRAENAFQRVLTLPVAGLTHPDRAFIAYTIFYRYGGAVTHNETRNVRLLLDEDGNYRAQVLGVALRLAHTLCGGAPGLLNTTRLYHKKGKLVLSLPDNAGIFTGEAVNKRLQNLAKAIGVIAIIETAKDK